MIPKLIHQTAKTADIPPRWRAYQEKVRSLHPDWEYRLWTDADNLAFVRTEFPDFYDAFVALPKNIMRADAIRYLLMTRLGGLYLDLDYEMLKPFDLLGHAAVLPWEDDRGETLGNCVFAAAPGHPFFARLVDDLRANPPAGAGADVLGGTGPGFVTRVYRQSPDLHASIHTPARPLFHPKTPRNEREYQAIVGNGVSYGVHHCDGTWREYTLAKRVRDRIVRTVRRFV